MSLAIEADTISEVLLADGWHKVDQRSFTLDSYEFMEGERATHEGGQSGVCATGFYFSEVRGVVRQAIFGPLTSILAVRYGKH